ncbi:MAG TPA: hypothetical protein VNO30_21240 [Kofleriaceae bacterium]|nr:hypothetical protein [Kofleriaceae bacterium]
MATHFIQIFVDCDSIASGRKDPASQIQMFADSATTVLANQGGYELSIQVNSGDDIQWSVFPRYPQQPGTTKSYSVLVSATYAWNDSTLLKNWKAYQGAGPIFVYQTDGEDIAPSSGDAPIVMKGDFRPFVEAHASLPGRPDPGSKQQEAYSFYINIYQGDNPNPVVKDYSWDPYVMVVQP